MTEAADKNKEVVLQLSNLSILFFKKLFTLFTLICKFFVCAYQDYIFNRNYKRYLKYIDIYETDGEDDLNV